MKKVSLDVWIQLIGMLGVFGGLVALVIELNQSQRLSQASAYQARNSEIQEAQRELALSEDFAEILQKFDSQGVDSLTLGERSRVVAWHSAMQWRMQGQQKQLLSQLREWQRKRRGSGGEVAREWRRK